MEQERDERDNLTELEKLRMVKPTTSGRPPKFRECPICGREFGSRSLDIHITACAEKHGKEIPDSFKRQMASNAKNHNKSNIKSKRSREKSSSTEEREDEEDDDNDVETSLSDELSRSWPRRKLSLTHQQRNNRYLRRRRNKERRLSRPRTAVLTRPTILDESLKDKVDMTKTKKKFLKAFQLISPRKIPPLQQRRHPAAPVGYRRGSGPGLGSPVVVSPPQSSMVFRRREDFNTKPPLRATPLKRPGTTTLSEPSNQDLPKISPNAPPVQLPPNPRLALRAARAAKMAAAKDAKKNVEEKGGGRRASLQSKQPLTSPERKMLLEKSNNSKTHSKDSKVGLKRQESVPEPCNSCGRSDLPERFHTHPPNENEGTPKSPTKIPVRTGQLSPKKSPNSKGKENEESKDKKTKNHNKTKENGKSLSPYQNSPYRKASLPAQSQRQRRRIKSNMLDKSLDVTDLDMKSSSDTEAVNKSKSRKSKRNNIPINKSPERASADESDNQNSTSSNGSSGSTGTTVNSNSNVGSSNRAKCSVCGKEFGKNSLKFHEPQCKRKEDAQRARQLLAEKEAEEKSRENATYFIPPSEEEETKGGPFDETFDAIWTAHVQQLVPCPNCGRTFFPDRIEVHAKWCKGAKPQKSKSVISLQSSPQKPKPTSNNSDDNSNVVSLLDAVSSGNNISSDIAEEE